MASAVAGTPDRAAVEGAPETPAVTAGEASEFDRKPAPEQEPVAEKEKEQA